MKKVIFILTVLFSLTGAIESAVAQGLPPTPPPLNQYDSDDAFALNTGGDEVHFVIMNSPFGQYRKYSLDYNNNWVYAIMNAPDWYAGRQSFYGNSNYSSISEADDWD